MRSCFAIVAFASAPLVRFTTAVIRWHRVGFQVYWRWKPRPHVAPLSLPGTPANYDYLCGSSRGNIGSNHCNRLANLLRTFAGVGAIPIVG